ncbi:hypothetical protein [Bacteroides gallinarum]|uniref:hypothetical protein n=1 Tax=Bacteroides gallinarum TaxID=376806 RepID=UPI0003A15E5B|nr:hypothetical protein [Bacteroides gallinarum]
MIAERFIHSFAGERKSYLSFGNVGVLWSAVCHTLISTCWMNRMLTLEYFKKFFCEIVKGRKD